MILKDFRDLFPYADTADKAYNLIKCAIKQGRSEIIMKTTEDIYMLIRSEGCVSYTYRNYKDAANPNLTLKLVKFTWLS